MTMPGFALRQDLARGDIQGGKQGGSPVANVVVGHPFEVAKANRQERLRSLERLHLALLIDTEHQGLVRRIEIQTDDVMHLVHEEGIGGQLEGLLPMRLQAEQREVALHLALGNPGFLGQRPNRPMGATLGLAVDNFIVHTRHPLVIDRARSARLWRIAQSGHAARNKPLAPVGHRLMLAMQPLGNRGVCQSICRPQNHFRPPDQAVGQRSRAGKSLQLHPLSFGESNRIFLGSSCAHGPSSLDRGQPNNNQKHRMLFTDLIEFQTEAKEHLRY